MKSQRLVLLLLVSALALSAQSKKKVLVLNQPAEVIADWRTVSDKLEIVSVSRDTVMNEIADAHAIIGGITPEWVVAGKNLEWVQSTSAGVERYLHLSGSNALRDSDIILTNNQVVQGPEIADHAMAMLLAMTRELPKWLRYKDEERWQGRPYELYELNGKTAVVIGFGGIGSQIGIRAWAHGMKVIGVDPEDMPFSPFVDRVVKPDQLDEVLPTADVVFMAAPHTAKSHKMMGASQFERMKKGSWFVAVSRGGTYDLGGMMKALDAERLHGAGVDVTDPEPLPKGHPLWGFENVIITPHIAGRSDLDHGRMLGTAKANLKRYADGLPLINVVDKSKGY